MIKFSFRLLGYESVRNKGARRKVGIVPILTEFNRFSFQAKIASTIKKKKKSLILS